MPESASRGVSALGGCLLPGGVSALGGICSGGCLLQGGLLWGSVYFGGMVSTHGGCLLPEVSAPRGCLLRGVCSQGGVSAPGGCLLLGGCGIPACTEVDTPPVNRMTNRCKNITLATTSSRPVKTLLSQESERVVEDLLFSYQRPWTLHFWSHSWTELRSMTITLNRDSTMVLLPSATKLRRLCFYTCVSVHRGGLPQCMLGYTPPPPWEQTPLGADTSSLGADTPLLGADTPLGVDTPLGAHLPLGAHPTQEQTPPPADGYCCGRYASYWNAFLFH